MISRRLALRRLHRLHAGVVAIERYPSEPDRIVALLRAKLGGL
jgi:hypothetical protein